MRYEEVLASYELVGAAHATLSPRESMGMTYDSAHGQIVLFGGQGNGGLLADTWTWDGTDRTKRTPAHHPSARQFIGIASDTADAEVVLFGVFNVSRLGDTWAWDGTDWKVPFHGSMRLTPQSGSPGTAVQVEGRGLGALEKVVLTFVDSTAGITKLVTIMTDGTGSFTTHVTIPATVTLGRRRSSRMLHRAGRRRSVGSWSHEASSTRHWAGR